jgi:AcrR family transcriptional regulator
VADAADVTKGAIYRHFANKEELFFELVRTTWLSVEVPAQAQAATAVGQSLESLGSRTAKAVFRSDVNFEAVLLEYLAACLRRPEALQRHAELVGQSMQAHGLLGPEGGLGLAEGAWLSSQEVEVVAQALVDGLRIHRLIFPDVVTPDTFRRAMLLFRPLLAVEGGERGERRAVPGNGRAR